MRTYLFTLALGAAACTVNGKPIFGGSATGPLARAGSTAPASSPSASTISPTHSTIASATSATGTSAASDGPAECGFVIEDHVVFQVFSGRIADPKLEIAGDQPRSLTLQQDRMPSGRLDPTMTCDAAHDHCLRACSWFRTDTRSGWARTDMFINGKWAAWYNTSEDDVHWLSVPATRATLHVGQQVFALRGGERNPKATDESNWYTGTVTAIDWDAGTAIIKSPHPEDPAFLSSVRIAVMRYAHGKLERIPGVEVSAPPAAHVLLPTARATNLEDPWAQIDAAGQPKPTPAYTPTRYAQDCGPAWNHCLPTWIWFVVDPMASREGITLVGWSGSEWISPLGYVLKRPSTAYRTRPAKPGELRAGAKVLLYANLLSLPNTEASALAGWVLATVRTVSRDGQTFTYDQESQEMDITHARIPVLWWLPGEKAEKVE